MLNDGTASAKLSAKPRRRKRQKDARASIIVVHRRRVFSHWPRESFEFNSDYDKRQNLVASNRASRLTALCAPWIDTNETNEWGRRVRNANFYDLYERCRTRSFTNGIEKFAYPGKSTFHRIIRELVVTSRDTPNFYILSKYWLRISYRSRLARASVKREFHWRGSRNILYNSRRVSCSTSEMCNDLELARARLAAQRPKVVRRVRTFWLNIRAFHRRPLSPAFSDDNAGYLGFTRLRSTVPLPPPLPPPKTVSLELQGTTPVNPSAWISRNDPGHYYTSPIRSSSWILNLGAVRP